MTVFYCRQRLTIPAVAPADSPGCYFSILSLQLRNVNFDQRAFPTSTKKKKCTRIPVFTSGRCGHGGPSRRFICINIYRAIWFLQILVRDDGIDGIQRN